MAQISEILAGRERSGVLLAGPPGVGKSRLASECALAAEAQGHRPVRVRATRAASAVPFGAFAPVLPVLDVAPETGPQPNHLRQALDALRSEAGDGRLLVLADDVHLLDEASATLLLQLASLGVAFVVATLRTGEPVPDPVTTLWKDELLQRLDVEPLSQEAVAELLEAVLEGDVDAQASRALHTASGGNVLYLRELVLGGLQSKSIRSVGGMWRIQGKLRATPRLAELIEDRLAGLTKMESLGLAIAAVAEAVGLTRLEETGYGHALDALERRGLIEIQADGRRRRVRVAHPLYGEVVRERLTTPAYRRICAMLADEIARTGMRRREDARRAAFWRLEAGQPADPAVLLAAARDARFVQDFANTERFARAALESGGGAEAGQLLGAVLYASGRPEEAEEVLAAAAAEATTDELRALVAVTRSENFTQGLSRPDRSGETIEEALAQITDEAWRDEVVGARATDLLLVADIPGVFALTDPVLERAEDRAFCQVALPAAMARVVSGRVEEAVAMSTRAFEVRIGLGDQVQVAHPGIHLVALAMGQTEMGHLAQAMGTAHAGYRGAIDEGVRTAIGWFGATLARTALMQGLPATAARFGRETASAYSVYHHPGARWGIAMVAFGLSHLGDVQGARAAIEELDAQPPTLVHLMEPDVDRARAWVVVAEGDLPRARSMLVAAADRAAACGMHALEAGALHDVARLGDPSCVVDRITALGACVNGDLMPVRIGHVRSLAAGDAAGLDAASEGFEALGALLWAAEAANEASLAHRRAGETRKAAAAATRAKALAAMCEGARTPALAVGTDTAVLTRREREIATLAAQGLSSRDIAEALFVSPRTVENHLQRAYDKLGVRSRADLAEALARAGL